MRWPRTSTHEEMNKQVETVGHGRCVGGDALLRALLAQPLSLVLMRVARRQVLGRLFSLRDHFNNESCFQCKVYKIPSG